MITATSNGQVAKFSPFVVVFKQVVDALKYPNNPSTFHLPLI